MEDVKVTNTNTKPDKKTKKKENEKLLKDLMDAGSVLAIKSKDLKFNKIIKDRSGY